MSTIRTRDFDNMNIEAVKETLTAKGIEFTENAALSSRYTSGGGRCDVVLKSQPSIGIKAKGQGVEIIGDFYHCTDLFDRPLGGETNLNGFMASLEALWKHEQYMKRLRARGARFSQQDLRPTQNNTLVIQATVPLA